MEDVISRYGLAAVFAGAFLEGDVTAILAGVVAHLGLVGFVPALLVVFVGGILRDTTCYLLGRSSTRARQSAAYERAAATIERLAGRFGALQILLAPFVYGMRTASMVFWGVHGLDWRRFLALDIAACAGWALLLCGAGYLLSDRSAALIGEVKAVEKWLFGALVAAVAVALVRRGLARRRAAAGGEEHKAGV